MQYTTKLKIAIVHRACKIEEKSLEYTFQLMQDLCNVDIDACVNYYEKENHSKLFREIEELAGLMEATANNFNWK